MSHAQVMHDSCCFFLWIFSLVLIFSTPADLWYRPVTVFETCTFTCRAAEELDLDLAMTLCLLFCPGSVAPVKDLCLRIRRFWVEIAAAVTVVRAVHIAHRPLILHRYICPHSKIHRYICPNSKILSYSKKENSFPKKNPAKFYSLKIFQLILYFMRQSEERPAGV